MTDKAYHDCLMFMRRWLGIYSGPFGWYNALVDEYGERMTQRCRQEILCELHYRVRRAVR